MPKPPQFYSDEPNFRFFENGWELVWIGDEPFVKPIFHRNDGPAKEANWGQEYWVDNKFISDLEWKKKHEASV